MSKTTTEERRLNAILKHVELAEIYLLDGARHSAICHLRAAVLVIQGKPVPKGPAIWKLAEVAP